jgi:hypothetical protein
MPTNHYFNPFPAKQITNEQLLIEDLVIEAMKIYGMDVYYMPRSSRDEVDMLYGEDTLKQYVKAYPLEMYLENVTGMDGDGDFISKFGLEIRDEVTMLVSRNRFKSIVPNLIRPQEGDLIFMPLTNNFFEITFVEHDDNQAMFYTLGRGRGGNVYVYALKMKKLVFSNEIIQTGIEDVDNNIRGYYPRIRITLDSVYGRFLNDEVVFVGPPDGYANTAVQALVYDFNPNIHIDVYRTIGQFTTGTLRGLTSGAYATITLANENYMDDNAFEDIVDNSRVETEADEILDWTEVNPFGEA